jgi:hypothetical protein
MQIKCKYIKFINTKQYVLKHIKIKVKHDKNHIFYKLITIFLLNNLKIRI